MPTVPGAAGLCWPAYGMIWELGLNPCTPLAELGIRMLPAISVPTPSTLPLRAISEPSPPVDHPAVNFVLFGFNVPPKTLLSESAVIMVWGTFVLQ
jgi:hypothetical protein